MKYNVRISEELVRTIEVEAEDEYEAYDKARDMYRDCEVVLTLDDYVGEPDIHVGEYMPLEDVLHILNSRGYSVKFLTKAESEECDGAKIMVSSPFGDPNDDELLDSMEELLDYARKVRDKQ